MPVGTIAFFLICYHPMHDWYDVHSEVPVMMWLAVCVLITWISDRTSSSSKKIAFSKGTVFEYMQ